MTQQRTPGLCKHGMAQGDSHCKFCDVEQVAETKRTPTIATIAVDPATELRAAQAVIREMFAAHDALVARVADYETMVMQITRRAENAEERVAELERLLERALTESARVRPDFAADIRNALAKEIEK